MKTKTAETQDLMKKPFREHEGDYKVKKLEKMIGLATKYIFARRNERGWQEEKTRLKTRARELFDEIFDD